MKYTALIGASLLIIVGVFWYINIPSIVGIDTDSMLKRQDLLDDDNNISILRDTNVPEVQPTQVVELQDGDTFALTASIVKQEVGNRTVKRLAYNNQIPGPVIKVQKGAQVTINFTNNIDMETALHSHGLRGSWEMDGAVPITPPVGIGETFSYELVFPDTGVFWYHPHVREDYQQDMGLYGNMVVEEDGYWNEVDQEEYLIIDDILEDGEYSREVVTNTLMGRFGDTLLINDQEDYNLTVQQGAITRVAITNVANTRTFKLSFAGAKTKLVGGDAGRIEQEVMIDEQIIGTSERYIFELYYDTPGTYPIMHRGEEMGTVTVESSGMNRLTAFETLRSNAGDYVDIRAQAANLLAKAPDKNLRLDIKMKGAMRDMMQAMEGDAGMGMMGSDMDMMDDGDMVTLMGMEMTKGQAVDHCQAMPGMAGCEPFLEEDDHTHEHDEENHSGMGNMMGMMEESDEPHGEDGIEWEDEMAMMNQMSTDETIEWVIEDTDTGLENGDIDWSFQTGELVKVRINNDENGMHPMQHPIHFHGQKFVVLAKDGELNDNLQWKDSVLIPSGQSYDILVDMSNPGQWMAHCHIAEHLDAGMMFQFEVN